MASIVTSLVCSSNIQGLNPPICEMGTWTELSCDLLHEDPRTGGHQEGARDSESKFKRYPVTLATSVSTIY